MKRLLGATVAVFTVVMMGAAAQAQDRPPGLVPGSGEFPATDPAPEGPPIKFLDKVAGKHPRLLFTADRIAQLRAFYNSPEAKLYRDQLLAALPHCTVPADRLTTAGWGQITGLMDMPTVALHYVLTGDKDSFKKCDDYLHWLQDIHSDWSNGTDEKNSDHAASFTMVGAALTWDWLYNDLDPTFREEFRQTLWWHARAMYYLGHLGGNKGGNYWRGVPAYNHRWFRDWGMTLATLAASDGKPDEQWMLHRLEEEIKFMNDWLPPDGSQHEGPSYGSSAGGLGMAFQASDECLGTHFLEGPFFKNLGDYGLHMSAPGMHEAIYFADCSNGASDSVHPFFLKTAASFHQPDVMDGIRHFLKVNAREFGIGGYAWLDLIEDDPSITGGNYTRLPTTVFLPDLGIAEIRENWQDQAVCAMFKCGPMGGYRANAWRLTKKGPDGALPYLNVAHDHPDANSFVLMADGQYVAETDGYPLNPGKLSSSVNTILINGLGQTVQGRQEGDTWQQPGDGDMTRMGVITAWKDAGDVVVTEGEAAGSYLAYKDSKTGRSRPALQRFRRTFIWVKGGYVLVLDDIRAPESVEITWLMQGAKLSPLDEAQGRYQLSKRGVQCDFQLVADEPFKTKIGESTANNHDKLLGWQQLQASVQTAAIRFVSVYDPWHHKNLCVALKPEGPDRATVGVTGGGLEDAWQWHSATGPFQASAIHGTRKGGFDVTIDGQIAVPPTDAALEQNR